jgi:hypothetical protein
VKKENIILIASAIIFLCIIARKNKIFVPTIKPGDKGNEVAGIQGVLTSITGLQFSNVGAYDNDTLNAVRYYLKDTNALVDPEKGYINKEFAQDLFNMQQKTNKS